MVLVVCLKETYWSRPVRKAGEKKKEGGKRAPKKIRPQNFFEKRGRSEIKKKGGRRAQKKNPKKCVLILLSKQNMLKNVPKLKKKRRAERGLSKNAPSKSKKKKEGA